MSTLRGDGPGLSSSMNRFAHLSNDKNQLDLELFPKNLDYDGKVISEEPYVKIMGAITWSGYWESLVAVAQVESAVCVISVKEKDL